MTPLGRLEKRSDGVFIAGLSTEAAVAADGWFAVWGLVAGALAAVFAAVLLRDRRLGALVGLAAGGVLGSLVAWRVGALLGPPSVAESVAALPEGATFYGPLDLSALGVLLAWSTAAVVVFFTAVAGLDGGSAEDTADASDAEPVATREPADGAPADPYGGLAGRS